MGPDAQQTQQIIAVVESASLWETGAAIVACVSGLAGLLTITARLVRRRRRGN